MWNSQRLALHSYLEKIFCEDLPPYFIPNIYIKKKPITIIDLENKTWGHCRSTLKSPKIVVTKYFFCISKYWQDVYTKLDEKYCELWGDLKSLEFDLLNYFIKIHRRWRFCMWLTYVDQNVSHHIIWKMRNIFQKWGYLNDILEWKFRWKIKMI
jgi:hypothetical protein